MPLIVDVSQKKISIGDKYTIAINGQPYYRAKTSIWKLFPKVDLMPLQGEQIFMSLERGFGFIIPKITFTIGTMYYNLETLSWFKHRFAIRVGKDYFEIVGHRGRKVSIFQNGMQIAWFDNEAVSFFSGDNYHCTANANAPAEWLIAIILFWDLQFNRGDKKAINIKFGNLLQSQPFDKSWRPY